MCVAAVSLLGSVSVENAAAIDCCQLQDIIVCWLALQCSPLNVLEQSVDTVLVKSCHP